MGFLEVVPVASLVVGMTPLDAKALLQIGSPLGTLIDLVVLNPRSRFCFVGSCRSKKLKLVPDPLSATSSDTTDVSSLILAIKASVCCPSLAGDLDRLGGVGVLLLGDGLLGGVLGGGRVAGSGRAAALAEDALDGSVGTGGLALDLGALSAGAVGAAFGTGANPIPSPHRLHPADPCLSRSSHNEPCRTASLHDPLPRSWHLC